MTAFEPGTVIEGFSIIRTLGEGGTSLVLEVEELDSGRHLAMKVLREEADEAQRARFARESELMRRVLHPAVLAVQGIGTIAGAPYYLMDLEDGPLLSDLIAVMATGRSRHKTARSGLRTLLGEESRGLRLPIKALGEPQIRSLVRSFLDVVQATAEAHRQGIIHLDIKPSNIILSHRGGLRLVDFGSARQLNASDVDDGAARIGTPRYMSPELIRGGRAQAGPQADVFALGASLYELITLRPAIQGNGIDELFTHAQRARFVPPRLINARIPRNLESILLKSLQREPTARYADAETLANVLQRFLSGREVLARNRSLSRRILDRIRFGAAAKL
jgi:hypothetical protein